VSIFERSMNDVLAEGRAAIAGIGDPAARLGKLAHLHLERLGRDKDLAVVFQVELRQSVKFMERFSETFLQDYFKLIRQAIADGQQSGAFRKDISATTATKIFFWRARRDGHQLGC
jgi:TetR/AcrR family fatty acid metabolism transcriptional regulator